MKKLVALALAAVVLAGLVWFFGGRAIGAAVEHASTKALGVPTRLATATLNPFSGATRVAGLEISNPPGFQGPHFLALDVVEAQVAPSSLLSDVIDVQSIVLEHFDLRLELTASGTNAGQILDQLERNVPSGSRGDESQAPSSPSGASKRLRIRELVLRDIQIHTAVSVGVSGDASATLKELKLDDLGGADGLTLEELIAACVEAVLRAAVQVEGSALPAQLLRDIEGGLQGLGQSTLDQVQKSIESGLESLGREAGKAAESLERGLGGFLRK